MRLSNFIFSSVLSFADKPKLAYLTNLPKKNKKTRKLSAKININSNMTFESKMNLKSIPVCSKSIKITAILVTFLRWLQCSWILYNYLSFSVRKSSLDHTKAEVSMEITFQTCGFVLIFEYILSCVIFTQICMYFLHKCLCNFTKHQLSFLQICDCYFYFPFIVN